MNWFYSRHKFKEQEIQAGTEVTAGSEEGMKINKSDIFFT